MEMDRRRVKVHIMNKIPKLIAKTVKEESQIWEIYDNFELHAIRANDIRDVFECGPIFTSNIRKLVPGKQYKFYSKGERPFEYCFRSPDYPHGGLLIDVFGFDPVKCKECGFEINSRVCSNCGEWQHE